MAPRKLGEEWRKRPLASDQVDSNSKRRKKNESFEPETQFLLRVPTHLAEQVRAYADATPEELDASAKKITIDFDPQFRNVKLNVNGTSLTGRVVDLPCIIEAHKTVDKKTVYKTNDISQLVICEEVTAAEGQVATDAAVSGSTADDLTSLIPPLAAAAASASNSSSSKSFQWPHGITPPMRNVRKRRFRRTLLQGDVEVSGLQRELRRIIQQDNEAVSFSWKIVYDDPDGQQKTQLSGHQSSGATTIEDAEDGVAAGGALVDGLDGDLNADMMNEDSNLSLSSGDSEHLDEETKARLKKLAEENMKNQEIELFGDFDDFSSSEDDDH